MKKQLHSKIWFSQSVQPKFILFLQLVLSCYLPTFYSITSGPKCQSSNQNGQIISYPCKDFQMYFYFSLFVKLQRNVTGKLPLFSVIWRFLRLARLAGAKNFFFISCHTFLESPYNFQSNAVLR